MPADPIRDTITQLRFFGEIPREARDRVADAFIQVGKRRRLPEGTRLFTQGEEGTDEGYILLEGDVLVTKSTGMGLECPAPELLGEMKQFNPNKLRTATVEAMNDIEVLAFSWPAFEKAVQAKLNDAERKALRAALQNYAWQHFTEA